MAMPIKSTPILEGKDAERFLKAVDKDKEKRISEKEYQKMLKNYQNISFKEK